MYTSASSYSRPLPNHHHRTRAAEVPNSYSRCISPEKTSDPRSLERNAELPTALLCVQSSRLTQHHRALMNVTSWMASAFESSLRPSLTESSAAATASGSGLKITVLFAETDPPPRCVTNSSRDGLKVSF